MASGLSNSPKMVVQGVDIEAKLVTAVGFSDDHKGQIAVFPASAIDRWEAPSAPVKKAGPGKKPGKK